jgi:pyrroline-5-carboxylate reductase
MQRTTIAFVGGGNMAGSLIGGLLEDGMDPATVWVSDPDRQRREALASTFAIRVTADNEEAADAADVVVLAVKPQTLREVAKTLAPVVQARGPLVISVAAGVRRADLEAWLGGGVAIVRTMPNTPALVRSGATALCANEYVSAGQRDVAESILRAVGVALWLEDESLLDVVTALSGSGPAYFFLVMEALEAAAVDLGLPVSAARLLTVQTAFGAAKMAMETEDDVPSLRHRVTSPGGTTEAALRVLETGGLRRLFGEAVRSAHQRSMLIAKRFGEQ